VFVCLFMYVCVCLFICVSYTPTAHLLPSSTLTLLHHLSQTGGRVSDGQDREGGQGAAHTEQTKCRGVLCTGM
jgi:hypothetical protein